MPSTYTTNIGIEKIATGEQSGTWGVTTNTNFDIIDQAINGIVSVTLASAGDSGSPNTIAITDGSLSDGRNKFIEFVDEGDLGATAYVQLTPNDSEKIVIIRNSLSGSQNLIVFQGTYSASNDFQVDNGKDVVLKFDGGGTGATVTQVFNDLVVGGLTAGTLNPTTINATTVNATTVDATNVEATNLKAKDGTTAITVADSTGQVTIADAVLRTVDINGGNIDGTAIGASTPSTANISTLSLGGVQVTANAGEINQLDGITSTVLETNDVGSSVLAYDANLQGFVDAVTLPTSDGTNGQVLTTDGAGNVTFASASGGISAVVDDTTPQLGGNLDVNGQSIVSATAGNITITPDTTGSIILDGQSWPQADGSADQYLKTDGAGQLSYGDALENVSEDTSPQLGGNLDVNGNYIVTTSNANLEVAPDGTGTFVVRGNDNSAKIVLNCEVNSHGVTIASPPHSAGATYELELPDADGTDGQALVTDGNGKLSFGSAGISTGKAIAMAIVFG